MKIVILGLTITSSWGNGHATTFRSLASALHTLGHSVRFIEKDVEWYRSHRDLPHPPYAEILLYEHWGTDGSSLVNKEACDADVLVIGSYFPDAIAATHLLLKHAPSPILFYDIDTPITLAALREHGRTEYLDAADIPHYGAYLSFTGGPALVELQQRFGSPLAVPFYCSVDPAKHLAMTPSPKYACDLSYLGTYAPDRQLKLMHLLNDPASKLPDRSFIVAGPMYPESSTWAANVRHISHVGPPEHSIFYSSSRFTLNLTRQDMVEAGYSPSVRLFEASACGATILSDPWLGIDEFLTPGEEILVPTDADHVVSILVGLSDEQRLRIGDRARERVLSEHTSIHRARQFESVVDRVYASRGTQQFTARTS